MKVPGLNPHEIESCPNESTLRALLSLGSDDSLGPSLREHLARCKLCQSRLDLLTAAPRLQTALEAAKRCDNVEAKTLLRIRTAVTAQVPAENGQSYFDTNTISDKLGSTVDVSTVHYRTDATIRAEADSVTRETPQQIGKYDILRVLGRGGMGTVWLGYDKELNRKVAIKSIDRADRALESRLRREGQAISRLDNENVVRLYSVETDQNHRPFLVMEFVDGESLAAFLQRRQRLDPSDAARIIKSAARGVHSAHLCNILHRDIKPSNILLGRDAQVRVADFGLASIPEPDERLTRSESVPGTPAYMSPEQAGGKQTTQASDVYSLGCVLYEAVTGVTPFQGTTHQILRQVTETDPRPIRQLNEAVPRDLETICSKAMSKEPTQRYSTALELAEELDRFLNGDAIQARPENALEKSIRWCRRNPRIAGLTTLVAALMIGITAIALWSRATVGQANRQLSSEKSDAQRARTAAETFAATASAQRQLALSSLNELVFDLQNSLKDKPGTLRLRKEILERALPRLRATVDDLNRQEIDHSTIVAWRRIGELESMLGLTAESITSLDTSVHLARESNKRHPEDRQIQEDLFAGLLALAGSYQSRRMNVECRELLTEARSVYESLVATEHVNRQTVLLGIDLEMVSGDSHYEENRTTAEQYYLAAIDKSLNGPAEFANDDDFLFREANLFGKLCRLQLQHGRIVEADENCRKWTSLLIELCARNPLNLKYQLDHAFAASRQSQINHQQNRHADAVSVGLQALDLMAGIAESDPEYSRVRMQIGIQNTRLALLHFSAGDFEDARVHAQRAFDIQSQLLISEPNDRQVAELAGEAAQLLGSVALANGETNVTTDWFQQLADVLTPFCDHTEIQKKHDAARNTADALHRIKGISPKVFAEWGQQAVPSSASTQDWMARAMAMRVASIAGDCESAKSIACRLLEQNPPETIRIQIQSLLIVSLAACVPPDEFTGMGAELIAALDASGLSAEIANEVHKATHEELNSARLVVLLIRQRLLEDPVYSLTILYFPELQPLRQTGLLSTFSKQ